MNPRSILLFITLLAISFPSIRAADADAASAVPDPKIAPLQADSIYASIPAFSSLKRVGSQSEERDFELIMVEKRQEHFTYHELQRARSEDTIPDPYQFSDVVGQWFRNSNRHLSRTNSLLNFIELKITEPVLNVGKAKWNRLRPCYQDDHVKFLSKTDPGPSGFYLHSPSFPSGHAASGIVFAMVLSDLLPENYRKRLLDRGIQFGDDRVLLGLHFPSDVDAGRLVGAKIYKGIRGQSGYWAAVKDARRECLREISR
jgi:acid phosphatase (class A)